MASRLLTKSKFMNGLQCPRLLWTVVNQPGELPGTDIASQHIFDQGYEIDGLAKKLYPAGIEISNNSFMDNIRLTRLSLEKRQPIFQAGFMASNLYSRVDIIVPDDNNTWQLIEVKSSTDVKPEHFSDVAYQRYCLQAAGLNISRCNVVCVNNKYVKNGVIDPAQILVSHDVTQEANGAALGLESTVAEMFKVMARRESPEPNISPKCGEPRDCPLMDSCYSVLPDHHVLTLTYGKKAGYALLSKGIAHIKDIPADVKLTPNQKTQVDCVRSGVSHVNREALQAFLTELVYPLAYFDFETISPAIPLYDGTRPYQKIPFQFSLILVPAPGAEPVRVSFLSKTPDDPRLALLEMMKRHLPDNGSVVVYNKSFEGSILKQLGESFPADRDWLASITSRFVDLLDPFKKFDYYHPSQKGSASIKKVLPALTGEGYQDLEIGDGETASVLYWNVTHKPAPEEARQKVYSDLETYCGLDTDGMRLIVEALKHL